MKLDPHKIYQMPLLMGPVYDPQRLPKLEYRQAEVFAIQYLSHPDAVRSLLPEPYTPAKEPIVTVFFGYNSGLDFMAGGEYRLATMQVAARFDGENDHVEGDYILVMFEDKTWPILGGREFLGVPKLYADISPIKTTLQGHSRSEASMWGHLLFGIEIPELKKQNAAVRLVANRRINARPWLGYKYIPRLDGPPDADYPTITWNDTKIEELWMGSEGQIYFGNPGDDDISIVRNLLDALETLPIVKMEQALHFRGSAYLRMDKSRMLS